jgi:glucose-6-phosphate 1-dehydrogenase
MNLDKRHLQFALHETDHTEACSKCPSPSLDVLPEVQLYRVGSRGPSSIQELIDPRSWRLRFERGWRQRR